LFWYVELIPIVCLHLSVTPCKRDCVEMTPQGVRYVANFYSKLYSRTLQLEESCMLN
jgi:hypothetical protein